MSSTLTRLAQNRAQNVTLYRVLDTDVILAYEQLAAIPPGRRRFGSDPETLDLILNWIGDESRVRSFYGKNHVRTPDRRWFPIERGNAIQLSGYLDVIFAVGVQPLPDSPPGLSAELSTVEDDVDLAHRYIAGLAAAGLLATAQLSNEWRDALCAPSPSIPEARGVLRHPIYPDGDAEGWVNEAEASLPPVGKEDHLRRLFSAVPMDEPSRAALYSYLFAAFHKCSLNSPRPLLMVDSIEQGVGKSVTGEAIATLVDREPRTLSLDRNSNEGDEIVAQLACGNRCLVIPNLACKRNWNNTLLATLCTDVGQARRLKYASHATTFYGTLGITSTVLGAVTLHRDLVSRLWRVALSARAAPSLSVVPQEYAKANREALQAEIIATLAAAKPYTGTVSTRFPDFERAGCAAYSVFSRKTHDQVAALMAQAEKARHVFRDEVMYSLYHAQKSEFREYQNSWRGIPEGEEWLKQYDGAHAFGYSLKEGTWAEA